MKINEVLAKASMVIVIFFFIRILMVFFEIDFLATITDALDYSILTIPAYGIVISSFVVSFFYFTKKRNIRNFKTFVISSSCLGIMAVLIFSILVIYANSMDGF